MKLGSSLPSFWQNGYTLWTLVNCQDKVLRGIGFDLSFEPKILNFAKQAPAQIIAWRPETFRAAYLWGSPNGFSAIQERNCYFYSCLSGLFSCNIGYRQGKYCNNLATRVIPFFIVLKLSVGETILKTVLPHFSKEPVV